MIPSNGLKSEFKISELIKRFNHNKTYYNVPEICLIGLVTKKCGISACKIKRRINLKNHDYDIFTDLSGKERRRYDINLDFLYGCDGFHSIKVNGLDQTDIFNLNYKHYALLNQKSTMELDTFNPIPVVGLTDLNSIGIFITCDKPKKITIEFEINYYDTDLRREIAILSKSKIITILDKIKLTMGLMGAIKTEYSCEKDINDEKKKIENEKKNKKNPILVLNGGVNYLY